MFRASQHPSSGALKTVTATTGIGHNMPAYCCVKLDLFINIESWCTEPWVKKKKTFVVLTVVAIHPATCNWGSPTVISNITLISLRILCLVWRMESLLKQPTVICRILYIWAPTLTLRDLWVLYHHQWKIYWKGNCNRLSEMYWGIDPW